MDLARIAELLQPFLAAPLGPVQLGQISMYIDLLLRWNSQVNLTAIGNPDLIVTRHFGESFFAARHLLPPTVARAASAPKGQPPRTSSGEDSGQRALDVGSGAGFPGLPIKIFDPMIPLTLLESNHKKVAFLREAIRALQLTDVNVTATRAEDFQPAVGRLVTLRAVERFTTILPTAARLVAPGGRLALLIANPQVIKVPRLAPSLNWTSPISIPHSRERILLIGQCPPTAGPGLFPSR